MTSKKRQREVLARKHRRLATGLETIDAQWRAYHRHIFQICAERLSLSEELVQFALTVAEPQELSALVAHLLTQREYLKLPADTLSELESVSPDSPLRLRHVGIRIARHNETLHPLIVDFIADEAAAAGDLDADMPATTRGADTAADGATDANEDADESLTSPAFPGIVDEIARMFSLSAAHARILMALYALEDIEPLSNLFRQTTHRTQMSLLADAAGMDLATFVQETATGSTLERLGLVGFRGGRDEVADINISRPLLFALRSNTLDDLKAGLFEETPPAAFVLSQFSISPEEIRTCAAALRGGHALLISGEPGIGKTEFARALVHSLGRRAHTLASATRRSAHVHGPRGDDGETSRFNSVRMAANLLTPATDVLIVDEADAVLQSAAGFFSLFSRGGSGGGNYDKAQLNDLLEHLPVPTVWITNEHRMIPASALRRFGHVVAFPHPSIDTRVRMLSERLGPLTSTPGGSTADSSDPAPSAWTRDLAARYDITPAAIDRAARIVAAELDAEELTPADIHNRVTGYMEQISTGALAQDVRRLPTVASSFDPRFCSTSESLDRIERQALHRAHTGAGLRLLFGGPPGGGKTQYALWLAKRLGRDVVLKRPSDLLSKYVGESEQQIAAAFRAAARAGSVLIIDEADALLYDRSIATRSWEHSQIAEFLQQIQEYTGVLVACTNRVDAVDPALRRRFHKHVTFGPISADVLRPALAHIFPEVEFASAEIAALQAGPPLMMSDLATAAEMMEIDELGETREPEAASGAATPSSAGTPGAAGPRRGRQITEEILANARSRDRTRDIGF